MDTLRVGSININGGRDRVKRASVSEIIEQKNLKLFFLQETHADTDYEVEWAMWWEGQSVFSRETNLSAGVAVLFPPSLKIKIISKKEIVKGRAVMVKVEIEDNILFFLNIYAPNNGQERLQFCTHLKV